MYKKFIINSNRLMLAKVKQHRNITPNHSSTRGGGWWHIDKGAKTILLYSLSLEFGAATREDIRQIVGAGNHDYPGYRFFHSTAETLGGALISREEL